MTTSSRPVIPTDVGWTTDTDVLGLPRVMAARLPGGPVVMLAGVAATIWLSVADGATPLVASVAEATGHPVATVRADIEAFVDDLVGQRLLEYR
ncbi:hypothetical protein ASG73_08020 [Janibacter sp. Soil728]|uniref:PqqD family protein n=1 Tax=Janibacter sp. Soil728 TaxID=1736393 RepID=UPI0006FA523B|nr:PqqD family protein [Janibacter sp. Soil728]KRE37599.1 hypothetical protein ASG73_08020 [Janibacter sp. Soil728]